MRSSEKESNVGDKNLLQILI